MPQGPVRVLIVDDSPEILEVVSLMLTRNGYEVETRNRVLDVIREVKEFSPGIIIIDQHLGWADGCDLCTLVKADKVFQQIPIIMFSAYHKTKDQCLFCGADAFLAKPFDMQVLLQLIRSLSSRTVTPFALDNNKI